MSDPRTPFPGGDHESSDPQQFGEYGRAEQHGHLPDDAGRHGAETEQFGSYGEPSDGHGYAEAGYDGADYDAAGYRDEPQPAAVGGARFGEEPEQFGTRGGDHSAGAVAAPSGEARPARDDRGGDSDSGGGIPYRAIALLLFTLVAILLCVGLFQLFSGGDSDDQSENAASTSSASEQPGSGQGQNQQGQNQQGQQPQSGAAQSAPNGSAEGQNGAAPSAGAGGDAAAQGGQGGQEGQNGAEPAANSPVRVLNNSTVAGLADDVANKLRGAGADVTEVGNFSQDNVPTSGVYYGNSPEEKATAEKLAGELGIEARPRTDGIGGSAPGVVVIVTQDMQGR